MSSSVEQALDRIVSGNKGETNPQPQPEYIPASTWQGSKPGYYFGTVNERTGYYQDPHQQQPSDEIAKPKKKSRQDIEREQVQRDENRERRQGIERAGVESALTLSTQGRKCTTRTPIWG